MQYKKLFLIVFCFFSILSTVKGATHDVIMYAPKPHLIDGTGNLRKVPVKDVKYEDGPKSALFAVHRGNGEYDIDKDAFEALPDAKWGVQTAIKFEPLDKDVSKLYSWKLRAFATCQFVGTMWERHCDGLLEAYDDQQLSPVFSLSLSKARTEALKSPVQIFCSPSCYDNKCTFNAYYTRDYSGHGKGIFLPSYATSCGSRHASGSFFTVAHEAGHSILDRFCPKYLDRVKATEDAITKFLTKQKVIAQTLEQGLSQFKPSILQDLTVAEYLSCRALHEAFGDITAILGSLSIAPNPSAVISRLNADTCFLKVECSVGCARGPKTETRNPLNYHGRSLLLTRKFCDLLKAENERLGDGALATQIIAKRFLDLVFKADYHRVPTPFETILANL